VTSADDAEVLAITRRVAPKFFEEGHERVYVAQCCGRVMVTTVEAKRCRTCEGVPEGRWVTPADLEEKAHAGG